MSRSLVCDDNDHQPVMRARALIRCPGAGVNVPSPSGPRIRGSRERKPARVGAPGACASAVRSVIFPVLIGAHQHHYYPEIYSTRGARYGAQPSTTPRQRATVLAQRDWTGIAPRSRPLGTGRRTERPYFPVWPETCDAAKPNPGLTVSPYDSRSEFLNPLPS